MKKLYLLAFLLILSIAAQVTPVLAQSINYTTISGASVSGIGSPATYTGSNTDSVWTVLQSGGTISGTPVYVARYLNSDGTMSHPAYGPVPTSKLWPYKVASAFSSSTVTSGAVVLPSGSLGTVAVAQGGTGATSASSARTALGVSGANLPDTVPVAKGGTGLSTVTGYLKGTGTANLGVVTNISIADGGTGSTTFSGAQTNLGWKAVVLSADTATTGQTALYTPLQFTIGATDVWDFDIYINPTNSGTNGTKVALLLPTSASVQAFCLGNVASIAAITTDIIAASATLGANFNTSTATADVIWIHGTVTGGGTAGAVVLGFAATTSGTATIKAKSYIKAHRIS